MFGKKIIGIHMKIVLVNLTKGGVAKTTLATNLATHYNSNSKDVTLIDMDLIQKSSYAWSKNNKDIRCFLNPTVSAIQSILKDDNDETVTIFDTGGYDLVTTQALMSACDVVLLPVSMSPIELGSFKILMQKIEDIKKILDKVSMNMIIVPSRIHYSVSSSKINSYFAPLKKLGYSITPPMRWRLAYEKSFMGGGSVVNSKDIKARTEIHQIAEFIDLKLNQS